MLPQDRRLVVITGLSGSGKTVVLHTLEDFGFYCIDNLPVKFLGQFESELQNDSSSIYHHLALGIDARNPAEGLAQVPDLLRRVRATGIATELIFLEANDEILLKRFSETRRRHPLSSESLPLARAIDSERRLLAPLAESADMRVDTTYMHIHQLRDLVRERIAQRPVNSLSLQFMSFGFKHGVPAESDFVFDLRCLPNPHWEASLRDQTGRDADVIAFLSASSQVQLMIDHIAQFLDRWVPSFERENRVYLTVAVGCTGGRHRSVYVTESLAEHFRKMGRNALVNHRDIGNG
jgi:RNase adapter protein RapZ